ncbi:hypothetical protein ACKI14_02865 [Streptomyces turgidiscabies]|uniref:hypothetical protein n=1 Tax=Streptomyces turgidiscabies TaxID=85558 RepID=UPI0038F6A2D6
MPPDLSPPGSARSAAALNEQIRALWISAGGTLTAEQKRLYDDLVAEWAAAMRGEVTEAA